MGIVKDRADNGGKLMAALQALVQVPVRAANFFAFSVDALTALGNELRDLIVVALDTTDAFGPADGLKECQALFLGPEFALDRYQALSDPCIL